MSSKIIIHFDDIIIHNDNSELYNPLNYALPLLHIYCIDNYNNIFDCSYISYAQTVFSWSKFRKANRSYEKQYLSTRYKSLFLIDQPDS